MLLEHHFKIFKVNTDSASTIWSLAGHGMLLQMMISYGIGIFYLSLAPQKRAEIQQKFTVYIMTMVEQVK